MNEPIDQKPPRTISIDEFIKSIKIGKRRDTKKKFDRNKRKQANKRAAKSRKLNMRKKK